MSKCHHCGVEIALTSSQRRYLPREVPILHDLGCFRAYVESRPVGQASDEIFPNRVEEGGAEMEPGACFSVRLGRYFRSWFEANAAEVMVQSWGWTLEYEAWCVRLGRGRLYIPDFLVLRNQVFLEIKGCWMGAGRKKFLAAFERLGPDRLVLVPTHLAGQFEAASKILGW
jgi:predicted nuclease of restriction endonuclease-like RecB superfamily